MNDPWQTGSDALDGATSAPQPPTTTDPSGAPPQLPPYAMSFLAHLRVLVGVPFEYLVPDPSWLPDDSIRFFYVDPQWTDRLVDGALAVGQLGQREAAWHDARRPFIGTQLEKAVMMVRELQRAEATFDELWTLYAKADEKDIVITGLIVRSALVSGWPHVEVRAYRDASRVPRGTRPADVEDVKIQTLRLERLGPSLLIALFAEVPELVILEEPHHGVQFGARIPAGGGELYFPRRDEHGNERIGVAPVPVPFRADDLGVVDIAALRRDLGATGSASLAVAMLQPPWRQRFVGDGLADGADDRVTAFAQARQELAALARRR